MNKTFGARRRKQAAFTLDLLYAQRNRNRSRRPHAGAAERNYLEVVIERK
jgi:hypothetical protein